MRQLLQFLEGSGRSAELVTPHGWARGRAATLRRLALVPLFAPRVVLERVWGPAHVWWYRTSHELVLRRALRQRLAGLGRCTVYAQCPLAARAALEARSGPHQRVVLAVHFRRSQADEWADKGQIARDRLVFRSIRTAEREVIPQVDGVVFVSEWSRNVLREWLPEVDAVPAVVIPNFIDAPPAGGRSKGQVDLVTVGSLEPVKNHRFLLHVLAAATKAGRAYSLDVFGEGPDATELEALAQELGLARQVRFRGFRGDVQQRLPSYRAYVHASYSESLPLSIIEAMAAGLPVLAADAGGVRELFDDGVEGRLWPLDDPEVAARILVELLDDPAALDAAGRDARLRFVRAFASESVAPRLLRFLDGDATRSDALERDAPGDAVATG
ncbi:glycosyltransferase family 4 protein [Terrabacter sp. NPDC080008]|uniref:glycosyltransferase family 4 protein n=1 Tax=Terrabacter sp. NPDC080008 TaxID=3155176 RepID=UPI00344FDF6D